MSENDYIAEYVKEKMPSIIETADFQLWKVCRVIGNFCNIVKDVLSDAFNNMDDDEVKKFLDQMKDNEEEDDNGQNQSNYQET